MNDELVKQENNLEENNIEIEKKGNNPDGVGGFKDNPENINRRGRPKKGMTLTDIAKDVLEEELPSGMTRKEALIKKVAQLAYDGNESMIKLLWNYVDGMPTQKTEVSGDLTITKLLGDLTGEDTTQEPTEDNKI